MPFTSNKRLFQGTWEARRVVGMGVAVASVFQGKIFKAGLLIFTHHVERLQQLRSPYCNNLIFSYNDSGYNSFHFVFRLSFKILYGQIDKTGAYALMT
ncbi:unnamed protein product [Clonostachys rosea]|uniref:Uncharacterized protein n=1 Tax=Bionectria ochroleuca TaxID=29856 RepID=A0ABY6UXR6_BIOOC|nr:unnamed protein product [Clonostachys rosea]